MSALNLKQWGHVRVEIIRRTVFPSFFVYVNVNSTQKNVKKLLDLPYLRSKSLDKNEK